MDHRYTMVYSGYLTKMSRKMNAFLKYKSPKTAEPYKKYTNVRNEIQQLIRTTRTDYWKRFTKWLKVDFCWQQQQYEVWSNNKDININN